MSSTVKTLQLLAFFTPARPEIGLSDLCKLAGRDKATTYRHLQALEEAGFVEQTPLTKRYRLGPALLRLAHTREQTVPRKAGAQAPLRALAEATGETAHVSVLSGAALFPLISCEADRHSTRVIIDTQTLPLHATASGLCALAFGPDDLRDVAPQTAFTAHTPTTAEALDRAIQTTRETGIARAERSFEDDVCSLSMPLYDQTGLFAGTVSVASLASRFTPQLDRLIQRHLILASRDITHNWGGTLPDRIEALWAASRAPALEPAP